MGNGDKKREAIRRRLREKIDRGALSIYGAATLVDSDSRTYPPPSLTPFGLLVAPCPGCERSSGWGSRYRTPSGMVWLHEECAALWREESERSSAS
ncbi:MAG TPA: hypothetical protein VEL75_20885 [Candidatus Methylomirabilis sp.]|nr:hypothetical protein [Candidatus Methylomirabilis sp.]